MLGKEFNIYLIQPPEQYLITIYDNLATLKYLLWHGTHNLWATLLSHLTNSTRKGFSQSKSLQASKNPSKASLLKATLDCLHFWITNQDDLESLRHPDDLLWAQNSQCCLHVTLSMANPPCASCPPPLSSSPRKPATVQVNRWPCIL